MDEEVDHPITPRERAVIELFAYGATYSEVATMLAISVNTVREHVRRAYHKLNVASKTEAVLRLTRLGEALTPPR